MAPKPSATALAEALAEYGAGLRDGGHRGRASRCASPASGGAAPPARGDQRTT